MIQPRVLCVMLANGRLEMVERAVQSFHAQTYQERELLIWDSAIPPAYISIPDSVCYVTGKSQSIGMMRNEANAFLAASGWWDEADIDRSLIAHWDSDDFSHPDRLTDQVRLIQQTGADCVGYNEMLFWKRYETSYEVSDGTIYQSPPEEDDEFGEAWLYTNPNPAYCIGTSLLYTREIWQRFPFPDCHVGEDTRWLLEKRIKRVAVTAMYGGSMSPRMIASIHGNNTSSAIQPGAREWKRAAEFDSYCRETMKL